MLACLTDGIVTENGILSIRPRSHVEYDLVLSHMEKVKTENKVVLPCD